MKPGRSINWKRILVYVIGINLLCMGINLNVRSGLGVAAFSTLPYSVSRIWSSLTFGQTNVIIYLIIIALQMLIERKVSLQLLAEIPFSFIFGAVVDLYGAVLPVCGHQIWLRILVLLCGNTLSAVGVFLMLQGNLVMAPVDGIVASVSKVSGKAYSFCKNSFDISMICITVLLCLVCRSPFYGIGAGTVFSALYVGRAIRFCEAAAERSRRGGEKR
ncbi:MAG: YitT family protein [Eubacterium sp.]